MKITEKEDKHKNTYIRYSTTWLFSCSFRHLYRL